MLARFNKIFQYYKRSRVIPVLKVILGDKYVDRVFPKDTMQKKVL